MYYLYITENTSVRCTAFICKLWLVVCDCHPARNHIKMVDTAREMNVWIHLVPNHLHVSLRMERTERTTLCTYFGIWVDLHIQHAVVTVFSVVTKNAVVSHIS